MNHPHRNAAKTGPNLARRNPVPEMRRGTARGRGPVPLRSARPRAEAPSDQLQVPLAQPMIVKFCAVPVTLPPGVMVHVAVAADAIGPAGPPIV